MNLKENFSFEKNFALELEIESRQKFKRFFPCFYFENRLMTYHGFNTLYISLALLVIKSTIIRMFFRSRSILQLSNQRIWHLKTRIIYDLLFLWTGKVKKSKGSFVLSPSGKHKPESYPGKILKRSSSIRPSDLTRRSI